MDEKDNRILQARCDDLIRQRRILLERVAIIDSELRTLGYRMLKNIRNSDKNAQTTLETG